MRRESQELAFVIFGDLADGVLLLQKFFFFIRRHSLKERSIILST